MLTREQEVLGGSVELLDFMGSDARIVDAARVSTNHHSEAGLTPSAKDERLIRRLWKDGHTSPFEQVLFTFRIDCPIFVARQWFRHRTGRYNEVSGRYSQIPEKVYIPSEWRVPDEKNKQVSQEGEYSTQTNEMFSRWVRESAREAFSAYHLLLANGVAREQARMVLPLNTYTQFYWNVDLHNLFTFLKLREAPDAQYEMQLYANAVHSLAQPVAPIAFGAFES